MTRSEARQMILDAATNASFVDGKVYRQRHINEAVASCRRRLLVSNDVLITAGFKPVRGAS